MRLYRERIREAAKRVLAEEDVDAVIGYRRGTIPFVNEPFPVKTVDQAEQLWWDGHCRINLANYLLHRKDKKTAVIAKGCDSRSLVIQLLENQIERDRVYILGAPCPGMLDRHRLTAEFNGRQVAGIEETESELRVYGEGWERSLARREFLQDSCRICRHRNPVIYDELLWDKVAESREVDRYGDIRDIEQMNADERWAHFDELISPCIRCYACRNVCPVCYCPTCFVDESRPQWVGKSVDPTDTRTFHLLRAFHVAGRCTDCGACEAACPMGIKVRRFTKKLEKDILELYGYEAGVVESQRPPLDTYRPDDPEWFIK